jgi:hypothetical protein
MHRSRTCPGSVFLYALSAGNPPRIWSRCPNPSMFLRQVSTATGALPPLQPLHGSGALFGGDPLLSDCIFNGPSERAMHSCLNARYQSEGMWRPATLVAAANWQNNFEFSNKNNDCTNHCGQQSKQRHQDGSQGPHRSGSCGDFEAALNVGPQFGSTLRSPTRATRRLGERTTAVYVEPPRPPRSAATEKPFGSLFTPSGAPPVGPGRPGPDLTAGGALPMFRSRQARLIPLRFGRVRRQPIGFT